MADCDSLLESATKLLYDHLPSWTDHEGPYNLDLDLEQAVKGTEVKIDIPTLVTCNPCDGTGAKPGSK